MSKNKIISPTELAEAHWKYIKSLLFEHKIDDTEIKRIGFHYRTAMIHGYKHGYIDAKAEIADPLFIPVNVENLNN